MSSSQLTPSELAELAALGIEPSQLYDSKQSNIYVAAIATYIIAIITILLRITARVISKNGFWWDDWLIFVATVLLTLLLAGTIEGAKLGVGTHIPTVSHSHLVGIQKVFYGLEVVFVFCVVLTKASVLAFYWRIFNVTSIQRPIYTVMTISIAWGIAAFFATIFQCVPVEKNWNPKILTGHCISNRDFFLGTAIPNIIIDFSILAMPMPYVFRLHISTTRKVLIAGIFLTGGFASISAIVRLWAFVSRDYTNKDTTWTTATSLTWAFLEPTIAIISACLPSLRPIITYIRTGTADPNKSGSTGASSQRTLWFRGSKESRPSKASKGSHTAGSSEAKVSGQRSARKMGRRAGAESYDDTVYGAGSAKSLVDADAGHEEGMLQHEGGVGLYDLRPNGQQINVKREVSVEYGS